MFIKLLEPREKLFYEADAGKYVISMHDLESKETIRVENAKPDDALIYDGVELLPKAEEAEKG